MTVVIDEFTDIKQLTVADSRGRVTLGATEREKAYKISHNKVGQILLTPVVAMPEYEIWLWNNPAALASVQQGLKEAAAGLGEATDFSAYVDLEIED